MKKVTKPKSTLPNRSAGASTSASSGGGADIKAATLHDIHGSRESSCATAGAKAADGHTPREAPLSAREMSAMFRAFSDHTRLRLLNLLSDGEMCVCDLVRILGMSQPKVSRHLAYLRRVGLVKARRDGLWMHYRLAAAHGRFHKSLLDCLGGCLADAPELARDRAVRDGNRLDRTQPTGGTNGNDCC